MGFLWSLFLLWGQIFWFPVIEYQYSLIFLKSLTENFIFCTVPVKLFCLKTELIKNNSKTLAYILVVNIYIINFFSWTTNLLEKCENKTSHLIRIEWRKKKLLKYIFLSIFTIISFKKIIYIEVFYLGFLSKPLTTYH